MGNNDITNSPQEGEQNFTNSQVIMMRQPLPNDIAVLVLGILSIPTCFGVGIIGLVLGIIALVLARKSTILYKRNSKLYTESSYSNIKAGKICAIIGVVLSSLFFFLLIIYLFVIGAAFYVFPWHHYIHNI